MAAECLETGRVLTIDYGQTAEELLNPRRKHGTLRAYSRQQLRPNPLESPGELDITADVNFTELITIGESVGLCTESFVEQGRFLSKIANSHLSAEWSRSPGFKRQLGTLTHPDIFGRRFRVLVQKMGSI